VARHEAGDVACRYVPTEEGACMDIDIGKITDEAKKIVDERGGVDALKEDAGELKDIVEGEGSTTDKAKAAVEAIKDPGAPGEEKPPAKA
jgi:hypothetical protein